MKIENFKVFKADCINVLNQSMTNDYAKHIYTAISGDVIEDVEAACDGSYNADDIRFAVGRVLCTRLGIEF